MAGALLSLGSVKPGDVRKPIFFRLMIQDEDSDAVTTIDLSEHQFALLLASSVVPVTVVTQGVEPEPVERGVWRHPDGTPCTSYPDTLNFTYVGPEPRQRCPHGLLLHCEKES